MEKRVKDIKYFTERKIQTLSLTSWSFKDQKEADFNEKFTMPQIEAAPSSGTHRKILAEPIRADLQFSCK